MRVLGQQCLVVDLLPFELLSELRECLGVLGGVADPGKPEVLQMQIADEVELTVYTN